MGPLPQPPTKPPKRKLPRSEGGEENASYSDILDRLLGGKSAPRAGPVQRRRISDIMLEQEEELPPGDRPMSVGGFTENTLNNLWAIAKGFVNIFPTAVKSGAEVFGDPEGMALLARHPEHLVAAFRDTAANLKDAMIDPYEKHGLRILYEEPITPVLDAMTILTLGGAGVAKAGTLAKSPRLFQAGNFMKRIPERIAQGIVNAPLRAVGINPETRTSWLRIRRREHAGAQLEASTWRDRILSGAKGMDETELAALSKLMHEGGTRAELVANPRIAAIFKNVDDWLKAERESELGSKGRALLTDDQMINRVVKEYAERKGLDFATAKRQYDALEVKPLYAPAIKETGAGILDIKNAFMEPIVVKKGKVGFLERFGSAIGATKNPLVRIQRAIDDFYRSRANLRAIDTVLQTPGMAKVAGRGEVSLRELLPSQGIFSKYGDKARAQSLFVSELEGVHGKDKAARLLRGDLETQKRLSQAVNISIPDETLRKLIRREFTTVGGDMGAFIRIYDRLTDLFRFAATKLSPRWYTGNVIGDALLASLAGANWPLAKRLMQQHVLPRTIRSGGTALGTETGNVLNSLSDMVGAVDDAARAGIFSKAVVAKLKSTMLHFGASEDALRLAALEVSLAPDQLADLMVRNQQLGEHVARQSLAIRKIDGQIAKTRRDLNASLMEETRQTAKALSPQVKGRPISPSATTGKLGKSEAERILEQLDKGKLTFSQRQAAIERVRELQAAPEIKLQRGAEFPPTPRRTRPSSEIQSRIDALQELRDSSAADLTKKAMQRDIESIPELARKAEIAEQAMDRANTFLGEYLGLGPVERGVFRRLVPFYPWTKAMSKLAFTFPFIAPAKAFFWHRYQTAMTDMMGDPELPEWMAAYAPVFARQNGDTVWARVTSLSPFGSLRTEHFGGAPIPSILAFWQANPWINAAYRMAGGRDTWSGGSVPYGEPLVAINDGEVYKFNEKGKLEKVVAQAPLFRSLAHMFMPVQMIDQLISNYDVRKGKPVLNADGTVRYPIELHQRLADIAGVKLMHRNREQAIKIEKLRVRQALEELKSQYQRAGPEERAYIKGVFEDYSRGAYRRIQAQR